MRIAIFNRIFSKKAGGAERYAVALVEELAAKHEFHVFAQDIDHVWPGVTYHRVSAPLRRFRWLNQLWYATVTWWLTRKGSLHASGKGFDIVHSHENTWHGNVQTVHVLPVKHHLFHSKTGWRKAMVWLKVLSSPRLITYLALEKARFSSSRNEKNQRQVVVTSPSLRRIFTAAYPNTNNISIITPGVATAQQVADKAAIKRLLGVPEHGFTIAFVGNRFDIKGLPTLLSALQALPQHVNLLAVGNAAQVSAYQAHAEKLGIGQRVQFLGVLNSVEQVYQAADCLAHPTLEDTFAMVVLEAMSYGLPVVVSCEKYCGIAGLLSHGQNALILNNPKDAAELTAALKKLISDSPLREHLSQNARQFADLFEWESIAKQQEAVYLKVKTGFRC